MKILGIVGGIGPESTIEYYRFILEGYRARITDGSAPHLIIDSIDVNRGIAMLDANDLAGLTNYISASVDRLTRAGADIALIAANTPHLVFGEVERRAGIPMISIVQAACDHARGVAASALTVDEKFYCVPASPIAVSSVRHFTVSALGPGSSSNSFVRAP